MTSRTFRMALLVMLVGFSVAFLRTERLAASGPTCTGTGTGFRASDPIMGTAHTTCTFGCNQNNVYCQIGTNEFYYDCEDDGSGPHPTNVQNTTVFCSFCPYCGYICC